MAIMTARGGAGLMLGPLVGAVILVPREDLSNSLLGGAGAGLTFVAYGAIVMAIARFQPGGILQRVLRLRRKARPAPAAPAAQPQGPARLIQARHGHTALRG